MFALSAYRNYVEQCWGLEERGNALSVRERGEIKSIHHIPHVNASCLEPRAAEAELVE